MAGQDALQFFNEQQEDAENCYCFDSGVAGPAWASVSHGIYISIEASGAHRSLGVRTSFVQSLSMDAWKPVHLRMMKLGGNRKFREFLREHGVPEGLPIRETYQTRAADWYRRNLRELAEGREPLTPLPSGTGHLPVEELPRQSQVLDQVFAAPASPVPPSMKSPGWKPGRVASARKAPPSPVVPVKAVTAKLTAEDEHEDGDSPLLSLKALCGWLRAATTPTGCHGSKLALADEGPLPRLGFPLQVAPVCGDKASPFDQKRQELCLEKCRMLHRSLSGAAVPTCRGAVAMLQGGSTALAAEAPVATAAAAA